MSTPQQPEPPTQAQISAMDAFLHRLNPADKKPLAIFLGAGASKTFGYPVTRELMLKIFKGLRSGSILTDLAPPGGRKLPETSGQRLWRFLNDLLPGKRMDEGKVPMVTGVLSLLDHSLATGQALLPKWKLEQIREMRHLLERALLAVIPDEDSWDNSEEEQEQRGHYEAMRKFLKGLVRTGRKIALITTNYDMITDVLAMEVAGASGTWGDWDFGSVARKVDYGFRWVDPDTIDRERIFARPEKPVISVFKLHGSTNWLRCPLCENIYINPDGPISLIAGVNQKKWDISCHCSDTELEAQIVSPSFVRSMREPNLIGIWKNALDFLREAGHWLIVGYSFPDEDVGIRALMTRAYRSQKLTAAVDEAEVTVIQRDDKALENYESFFPREKLRYLTGGLGLLLDREEARRSPRKKPRPRPKKRGSAKS